ncbi:hypothetical protein K1719_044036 [Acacia pycnantha]|nr:hypothetical protein K1719_044036 [Acacia pycnantha]
MRSSAYFLSRLSKRQKPRGLPATTPATVHLTSHPSSPKCMWHEGFVIIGSCYDDATKVLPEHDLTHFCETMEEIQKQLKKVAEKVTNVVLELLEVSDDEEK